jgi:hypothetical protein
MEVVHCPFQPGKCSLEARYDTTPPSDNAVASIMDSDLDGDDTLEALTGASGKVYRGESCQTCGAFFPAA